MEDGAKVATLPAGLARTVHEYERPTAVPVSGSVLAFVSWIGMRNGTGAPGFGPATAVGARSTPQRPLRPHCPLQHDTRALHGAPPGTHCTAEVHRSPTQSRGAWQSPSVRQTPFSSGFGMHVP